MNNVKDNQKLHDEMLYFYCQLVALQFFPSCSCSSNKGDLIESLQMQYESFMKQIWDYENK